MVERACAAADTTLIYVTHHVEELPDCITHVLKLRHGRVARKGTRASVLRRPTLP